MRLFVKSTLLHLQCAVAVSSDSVDLTHCLHAAFMAVPCGKYDASVLKGASSNGVVSFFLARATENTGCNPAHFSYFSLVSATCIPDISNKSDDAPKTPKKGGEV